MPTGTAAQRIIEIDGSELDPEVEAALESALVLDRLAMPDMFQLVFRDPARDVLSKAGLTIGAGIVISTSSVDSDSPAALIDGEVTSIEAEYDSLGTRAVVRGYDRSHRLAAGRRTQTFQNVKYSDIAQQVAGDAGLSADVDDSGGTLEHVLQANQSDLDFLYGLAKRIGFDCRVDGEKLLFKKPATTSGAPGAGEFEGDDPTQLIWNDTLLEFRARMSAVGQVRTVKVRGWDVEKKEAVIGEAEVQATNAELSMTNADLADTVHGDTLVVVDHPVEAQDAADQLAAARAEQVGSAAFEATAVAMGSPALKSGVAVHVERRRRGARRQVGHQQLTSRVRQRALSDLARVRWPPGPLARRGGHRRFAGGMAGAHHPRSGPAVVTDNDDPSEHRPCPRAVPVARRRGRVVVGAHRDAGRGQRLRDGLDAAASATRCSSRSSMGDVSRPDRAGRTVERPGRHPVPERPTTSMQGPSPTAASSRGPATSSISGSRPTTSPSSCSPRAASMDWSSTR